MLQKMCEAPGRAKLGGTRRVAETGVGGFRRGRAAGGAGGRLCVVRHHLVRVAAGFVHGGEITTQSASTTDLLDASFATSYRTHAPQQLSWMRFEAPLGLHEHELGLGGGGIGEGSPGFASNIDGGPDHTQNLRRQSPDN